MVKKLDTLSLINQKAGVGQKNNGATLSTKSELESLLNLAFGRMVPE